ncbi:MAG: hypothetical protein KAU31_00260, partial [Spirochaetaceae bacterium]|nr:hypothetical protein [Spirochaetaceae bacterium]
RAEDQPMTIESAMALARRWSIAMSVRFFGSALLVLGAVGAVIAGFYGRGILNASLIGAALLGSLASAVATRATEASERRLQRGNKNLYNELVDRYERLLHSRSDDLVARIARHRNFQSLRVELIEPFLAEIDRLRDLATEELARLEQTFPYFFERAYENRNHLPWFKRYVDIGGVLHMIKKGESPIDQMVFRYGLGAITDQGVLTGSERPDSDFCDNDGIVRLRVLKESDSYDILGKELQVRRVSTGHLEPEIVEVLFEKVSVYQIERESKWVDLKDREGSIVHGCPIDHLTTIRHFIGGEWMKYFDIFASWCLHQGTERIQRDRVRLRELSPDTEQQD